MNPSATNTFVTRTARIFDTPLSITSYRRLCHSCHNPKLRNPGGSIAVAFTDLNMLFLRQKDEAFRECTNNAIDLFIPDGASLRLLLARKGVPLGESLTGDRFMRFSCLRSPEKVRHYVVGGTSTELSELVERLRRHNPRLTIVGSRSDFTLEQEGEVVADIIRSEPDILWICLPTPRQEGFLSRWKPKLPCRFSILVGAGFDFRRGINRAERDAWRRSAPWLRRTITVTRRNLRRCMRLPALLWMLRQHPSVLRHDGPALDLNPWVETSPFWQARRQWRAARARWTHEARHLSRAAVKRAFDIVAGAILAILFSPLIALTALAIFLVDGRPLFFAQRRVGRNGRIFKMWKFRTMRRDAELLESKAQEHKIDATEECFVDPDDDRILKLRRILLLHSRTTKYPHDPRIIRFGRLIRKCSLDELPQLLNILAGDMSLVGPRPFVTYEVAEYSPRHLLRHAVKPGLTGPWQISDRNQQTFDESIALDLLYVRQQSFWLDFKIVLKTVPSAFKNRGGD